MEKQKQKVSRPLDLLDSIFVFAFFVSLGGCVFSGGSRLFSYYFPAKKTEQTIAPSGAASAIPGTTTLLSYSRTPGSILIPEPGTYSFLLPADPDDPNAWGEWLWFQGDDFVYRFDYDAPSYSVFFQCAYRDGTRSPVIRDTASMTKNRYPEKPVAALSLCNADSHPVKVILTVSKGLTTMELWIYLSLFTWTGSYFSCRIFRVPADLFARHGQRLYRPGWHFQVFLDPLEIIDLSPRTASVERHTILLPDGSELAVSFVLTWTPDTRYLSTFINQETETIEKLLTVAARSAFLKWGMCDDARNLHRVLSSQKNAEKFVSDALIEVSVSLGVLVNRVNITEVKPVSLPQEGRWGTADLGDRAAVVRKRIEAFDQIEATRATLKNDFPSRADDVDDESDFERIRVKEKRR